MRGPIPLRSTKRLKFQVSAPDSFLAFKATGCGSMVECSLRVREIPGSSPGTPTTVVNVAEGNVLIGSFQRGEAERPCRPKIYKMKFPTFKFELEAISRGASCVIGTDEVGAGPLAGPVVAAAVVLKVESVHEKKFARVRDSKTVGETERIQLAELIKEHALAWAVAEVSVKEIDAINIRQASWLAMRKAVRDVIAQLGANKKYAVFIDGAFKVGELGAGLEEMAIVGGDGKVLSIAAASLIAKVHRDSLMSGYAKKFPVYGFERHKGYGTAVHIAALAQYGPCAIHRKTFLKNFA